jgi:hypothetical protein
MPEEGDKSQREAMPLHGVDACVLRVKSAQEKAKKAPPHLSGAVAQTLRITQVVIMPAKRLKVFQSDHTILQKCQCDAAHSCERFACNLSINKARAWQQCV